MQKYGAAGMLNGLRQIPVANRMKTVRHFPLLLCVLLTACQSVQTIETEKKLRSTLRTYEDVMRWGRLQKIYVLTVREPGQTVEIPDDLDNVRVMGYEVVSAPRQENEERWTQTVLIEYVKSDQQVVQSLVDDQIWELSPVTGNWYRANPIPNFN